MLILPDILNVNMTYDIYMSQTYCVLINQLNNRLHATEIFFRS